MNSPSIAPGKPYRPQSVLRGVTSSGAAGLISLAVGIFSLPIVIATVGAGGYGVWLVAIAATNYLYFADLGIGSAVIHFGSRTRNGDRSTSMLALLATGLVWMLFAAILVAPANFLFAQWYADTHADAVGLSGDEVTAIVGCATVLACGIVLRIFPSVLIASGRLATERLLQLVGVTIRFVGIALACLVFDSLIGVVIAETAALMAPSVMSALAAKGVGYSQVRPHHVSRAQMSKMLGYGGRAFTVNAIGAMLLQSGTLITGLVASPSDVTYFNAANRLYLGVRQMMAWITDPLRPTLSRLLARGTGVADAGVIVRIAVTLTAGTAGLAAVAGSMGALWFVRLWLGDSVPVGEISLALVILLIGLALNACHIPLIPALDAAGFPGAYVVLQATWLVSTIVLSTVLGASFGIAGVAAGISLPLLVLEPLYLRRAARLLPTGAKLFDSVMARYLAIASLTPIVPSVLLGVLAGLSLDVQTGLVSMVCYVIAVSTIAWTRRKSLPAEQLKIVFRSEL